MKMALKTTYHIKAIPVIQSFVVETARFYGANTAECNALKLSSEKATEHIILNYPQEQDGQLKIFCTVENGTFKIVFSNMGLPVDKENIPHYKVENPEESIDGLKFFLIRRLTDNFYFLNKGTKGWQTVLEKKIAALARTGMENESAETKAAGIAEKTIFYYPEMLKEAIENKTIIPFVAKNSKNEIVIHSALYRSPQSRRVVETSALMSSPEYRKNSALIRLLKKESDFSAQKTADIDIAEANLVTAHTGSQRIIRMFNFTPFALKLSIHDRSQFVAMKTDHQRETLLYSLQISHHLDKLRLIIPDIHREMVSNILGNVGLSADIKNENFQPTEPLATYSIGKNISDRTATIQIEEFGKDWIRQLKAIVRELGTENIITFYLKIPSWKPLLAELDDKLTLLGFFFSGILVETPEKWMILYTKIDRQKFDYSKINLIDDQASKLKNYIQHCHEKVLNV